MADLNKKGANNVSKKNPDHDKIQVLLEAALGIKVSAFTVEDFSLKRYDTKPSETILHNIFSLSPQNGLDFKFGSFDLNEKSIGTLYTYYFGQANFYGTFETIEPLKLENQELINPKLNKNKKFHYKIPEGYLSTICKTVNFDVISPVACCDCKRKETETQLLFCLNDKQYFCHNCDKSWHEQKDKKALTKHYRTPNYKYTLTYFGNCPIENHSSKAYQYFNKKSKQCLCTKCVDERTEDLADIDYIDDYLTVKNETEKYLSAKIERVCGSIKDLLKEGDSIWEQINSDEKDICEELDRTKNKVIEEMKTEAYARSTFLSCVFMEIQRIITEIDSKVIFNKNQKNNVDVSTFLYMNSMYSSYMRNELSSNLDFLSSTNIEPFSATYFKFDKVEDNTNNPIQHS